MKKIRLLMMLAALLMCATSFAQGIKGTVIDENGEPVIGATIVDKANQQNATITDFDGNFIINVKAGAVITFSTLATRLKNWQPKTV